MTSTEPDLDYLRRVFRREADAVLEAVKGEQLAVQRQNAAAGRLQSGATLIMVREKYEEALRLSLQRMVRATFDATGSTSSGDRG